MEKKNFTLGLHCKKRVKRRKKYAEAKQVLNKGDRGIGCLVLGYILVGCIVLFFRPSVIDAPFYME